MRPRVLGNDYCEHFRSVSGGLLAIGYLRPMQVLSRGVLLAICAGLLEVIQLWSRPDRKRRRFRRHYDWRVDRSDWLTNASLFAPINRPDRFAELQRERR